MIPASNVIIFFLFRTKDQFSSKDLPYMPGRLDFYYIELAKFTASHYQPFPCLCDCFPCDPAMVKDSNDRETSYKWSN